MKKYFLGAFLSLIVITVITFCYNIFNPVRILLITDYNYVKYAIVTINSIIKNKNPLTRIEINIAGLEIQPEQDAMFLAKETPNVKINILHFDRSYLLGKAENMLLYNVDNLKFFATEFLPNYDRILYLDADVIVLRDLSKIYHTKLGNNYAAAVDDWQTTFDDNSGRRYFNNGVMLLNLKQMREDNIDAKLLEAKRNKNYKHTVTKDSFNNLIPEPIIFVTQDAFNNVMSGRIVYLPLTYNTFAPEYDSNNVLIRIREVLKENFDEKLYPYKTADEYRKAVAIIHYCGYGNLKPWEKYAPERLSNTVWFEYLPFLFWVEMQEKDKGKD